MSEDRRLGVWLHDRDDADRLCVAAVISQDRLSEPDLEAVIVSARADHMTVQFVRGAILDPTDILYLEGRGTFEILRVEPWDGGRTLVVLRAWPSR